MNDKVNESTEEHELLRKIGRLRKKRAELQSEINYISIQLESYEDAAVMVYGQAQFTAFMAALMGEALPSKAPAYGPQPQSKFQRRKRSISVNWAVMLTSLNEMPTFGYQEIVSVSDLKNLDITIAAARSQMKTYIDGGLVQRVGDGKFSVTDQGLRVAMEALSKVTADSTQLPSEQQSSAPQRFDNLFDDDDDVNPNEVQSTLSAAEAFGSAYNYKS
ncbi:hypothetical protein ASF70_12980 [Rhizobium sp. Leaf321]|uniref:hypothetical protein n=1 Tax=Rhizobium sp. Leaf321 TaxID=1736335 RepID=UPI0007139EBE|nr:hypothetical protein [Rhizobium sp. Leaf321]KQQ72438.1 hypothetical protein ASF70_12980 [Rhizobium sp. Leaf321]